MEPRAVSAANSPARSSLGVWCHASCRAYACRYAPPTYEAPVLAKFANHGRTREERLKLGKKLWADRPAPLDADLLAEVRERLTYENGGVVRWDDVRQLPLNPSGRTGLAGRGLLGKWGPNHAADPIVTRLHPATNQLQMVAIERADQVDASAIPGGCLLVPSDAV